jgi:thiamine-phosphate diphosphorylase
MLPRVHAVTDARVLARTNFLELAKRVATLGTRVAIHLRDRTATGRALAERASALRAALDGSGTPIIVNARPDIAAAVAADGVHLGQGDLGVGDARIVFRSGWIGRSVHATDEAHAAARDGADYLMAGSTWASASHAGQAPQGTGFVASVVSAGLPVIAIGGATPQRARELPVTGAHGVAAIRAIWDADDPALAVQEMLEAWEAK